MENVESFYVKFGVAIAAGFEKAIVFDWWLSLTFLSFFFGFKLGWMAVRYTVVLGSLRGRRSY
ncbi:MAG: hypothetical protein F6J90_01095 [Moorea sp. SIOASIH]|uniref:hypothetical protein n=1 Tax=Moorena sp. SIOASIH TaxID=2607817 RepID=UPI0013BD1970|nr:hypothetical protein [Moorena sp. SIOASIH]NEO34973.1 hypothetical protein [Moorena sp. SIOASIH]